MSQLKYYVDPVVIENEGKTQQQKYFIQFW